MDGVPTQDGVGVMSRLAGDAAPVLIERLSGYVDGNVLLRGRMLGIPDWIYGVGVRVSLDWRYQPHTNHAAFSCIKAKITKFEPPYIEFEGETVVKSNYKGPWPKATHD
jgi:hypothetical protein